MPSEKIGSSAWRATPDSTLQESASSGNAHAGLPTFGLQVSAFTASSSGSCLCMLQRSSPWGGLALTSKHGLALPIRPSAPECKNFWEDSCSRKISVGRPQWRSNNSTPASWFVMVMMLLLALAVCLTRGSLRSRFGSWPTSCQLWPKVRALQEHCTRRSAQLCFQLVQLHLRLRCRQPL